MRGYAAIGLGPTMKKEKPRVTIDGNIPEWIISDVRKKFPNAASIHIERASKDAVNIRLRNSLTPPPEFKAPTVLKGQP